MSRVVLVLALLLASCATRPAAVPTHTWPKPCDDCIAGIDNFSKVDAKLWRGGQPDPDDPEVFRRLAAAGVKTVINLRDDHDDFPRLQDTGLRYVNVPMHAWHPEREDVVLALAEIRRALADPNAAAPVYVHCKAGKDRTGYVIAAWRIVEEDWDADTAIEEMFDYRYNTVYFGNPDFLRRLEADREEIRERIRRAQ
jgi:protein tyrosine/serine phosphatase